jgi:hypothetical protein
MINLGLLPGSFTLIASSIQKVMTKVQYMALSIGKPPFKKQLLRVV